VLGRKYTRTSGKNHERLSQHEGSGADGPSSCTLSVTPHARCYDRRFCVQAPGTELMVTNLPSSSSYWTVLVHRGASNKVNTVLGCLV